jgi:hypothetical protein
MTFLLLSCASVAWLVVAWHWRATRPDFGEGTVQFAGQPLQQFRYPLEEEKTPRTRFVVLQNVELGAWHPSVFAIFPEDALWSICVNGHAIEAPGLPLSVAHHEGRSVDFGRWLHPGSNQIEFEMEAYWGHAKLHLYASPWDGMSIVHAVLVVLAIALSGAFVLRVVQIELPPGEAALLLGGFVLRYLYISGTPYFVRAYDWWGHEAYVDYVAQHFALPDARTGWENFQPPLYYLVVGGLTRLFRISGENQFTFWQVFSLACSTGVLVAGAWIARILFPGDPKWRLYLLAVLAVAPPLVFNASRVSNDVLLSLLEFACLGLLLQFWKSRGAMSWAALSVLTGLALLTKANALVLVPVSLLCLLLAPTIDGQWKWKAAIGLLVAAGVIAGWYYVPRFGRESGVDSFIVGNIHQLNPKGHIDGVFTKSLVFNPFRVVRYPFADPWGPRHEYFLEYFFRSIFIGEPLGPTYRLIARIYLFVALLTVPLVLAGLWISGMRRKGCDVPILNAAVGIFFAQWVFVQIASYTSSQDFRFSALLLVPFAYFYFCGAALLPEKWGRVAWFALQLLILNSGIYLLEVALEG